LLLPEYYVAPPMMRLTSVTPLLLVVLCASGGCASSGTNVLPGLTYYPGPEKLAGKLAFLLSEGPDDEDDTARTGAIYDFNLDDGVLHKVVDSPCGSLFASASGSLFCVISESGGNRGTNGTTAFVYSASARQSRRLPLPCRPSNVVLAADHVLFELKEYPRPGEAAERLLDYNFERAETSWVKLPDSGDYQFAAYRWLSAPASQSNIVQFYYSRSGRRLREGRDYETGLYDLDVQTGSIRWAGRLGTKPDNTNSATINGMYVFFEGPQAPISGFRLVTSPWDYSWSKYRDPEGHKLRLLHAFGNLPARGGGNYILRGISPCGKFALVMLMRETSTESAALGAWTRTYWIVDIVTGSTRILLEDEIERSNRQTTCPVYWVQ
jgi:hypothetical protein